MPETPGHKLAGRIVPVRLEAGCDEAGRGCLAGPVFAAAVILPCELEDSLGMLLNDSKKMSVKNRILARKLIEQVAVSFGVASVDPAQIDKINILNASIKAMHLALEKLSPKPEYILVDGNRFQEYGNIPYGCFVKGDASYQSIAAASVLAKTYRDDYMDALHERLPWYGWNKNKGYPTSDHIRAIEVHGQTAYHRKSFVIRRQLRLDF